MRSMTGMGLAVAVALGGFAAACSSDEGGSSNGARPDGGGGGKAGGGTGGRAAAGGAGGQASGGAGPGTGGTGTGGAMGVDPFVRSSLSRVSVDAIDPRSASDAVAGNEAFAFDLYARLRTEPGNLFYSPFSVTSALAMAWAGARGVTATEMATVLHFGEPAATHAGINAVEQRLTVDTKDLVVRNANAFWLTPALEPLDAYLDVLAVNYGAGVGRVDFSDTVAAADLIDAWVAERTLNTIPRLLEPEHLVAAKAVLTNALYFKGLWANPFDEQATAPAPFHREGGAAPSVPFMHFTGGFRYAATVDYQAAALRYVGDADHTYEMVVVLPTGPLAKWEADLDAAAFDAVVGALAPQDVELAMPRFEFRSSLSLASALRALGMPTAFEGADFSGISEPPPGKISDVIHQAFVSVDEGGTVASGATAVVFADGGVVFRDAPAPALTLDRPFFVAIRHVETGALLFMGRVSEP